MPTGAGLRPGAKATEGNGAAPEAASLSPVSYASAGAGVT